MTERETLDSSPPVVYMHQIRHGEASPILLSRTDNCLVFTLYHLSPENGYVCAYYERSWEKGQPWSQRLYFTPTEAEDHLKIVIQDWNDSRNVKNILPEKWYEATLLGTEVSAVDHIFVDEVGQDVTDPVQQSIDTADKISIEEFLERLHSEGVNF